MPLRFFPVSAGCGLKYSSEGPTTELTTVSYKRVPRVHVYILGVTDSAKYIFLYQT